jgi:protein-tyrosine phosphatase
MLDAADLVLVMEPSHRSLVLNIQPLADTRTLLLGELAGLSGRDAAVPDPFGGPAESYRRTFQRLETLIRGGRGRLLEIVARKAGRT